MSKVFYRSAKHCAWWDELQHQECQVSDPKSIQVYEADADVQPTGLLDVQGQPLMRVTKKSPIGFKWSTDQIS
jgi:hypothetical protein